VVRLFSQGTDRTLPMVVLVYTISTMLYQCHEEGALLLMPEGSHNMLSKHRGIKSSSVR
jgi:hypothetical protein